MRCGTVPRAGPRSASRAVLVPGGRGAVSPQAEAGAICRTPSQSPVRRPAGGGCRLPVGWVAPSARRLSRHPSAPAGGGGERLPAPSLHGRGQTGNASPASAGRCRRPTPLAESAARGNAVAGRGSPLRQRRRRNLPGARSSTQRGGAETCADGAGDGTGAGDRLGSTPRRQHRGAL